MCQDKHQKTIATTAGQFCLECGDLAAPVASNDPANQKSRQAEPEEQLNVQTPAIHGHSDTRIDPSASAKTITPPVLTANITPKLFISRHAL